jgi:hypothetical protein
MDSHSQAMNIIHQAESELRNLLLRSAELGDYETARVLAEWANHLKQMVERNGEPDRQSLMLDLPGKQLPARPEVDPTNRGSQQRAAVRKPAVRKTRKQAARGEYPKFLRDGEELLKIGWSKRTRATYRHKAPKRVLNLVAQALVAKGRGGARFAMDDVFPIRDTESSIDVPSYQAYLILAWLRKEKLVVQHGREGYSLPPEINLTDAIEERWKLLRRS